jgi:hypothetical protein
MILGAASALKLRANNGMILHSNWALVFQEKKIFL